MFIKNGYTLSSAGGDRFKLCDKDDNIVVSGSLGYGNFVATKMPQKAYQVNLKSNLSQLNIMHQAAGHPSIEYFYKMYPDLPRKDFTCTTCDVSKRHKEPFFGHFPQPTQKLEYIHINLCGPISPPSESGSKYFLRAVDGYSHFVWVRFLTYKSEVAKTMQDLFSVIKNKAKEKISYLVTDNGTEFKNHSLHEFYTSKGIAHLTTAPYHPENNPFAKQGNQTTVEKARCILKDSGLGLSFWAKAVNCAVHLKNLSPCKSINFLSPSKMWFGRPPNCTYLHPFRCQAIYLLNRSARKFRSCGAVGIFLGYGEGHRSFRVPDEETGNVHITHHVKFNDHVFPACQDTAVSNCDEEIDLLFLSLPNSSKSPSSDHPTQTPEPQNLNNSNNGDHPDDSNCAQELEDQNSSSDQSESENNFAELLNPGNQQGNGQNDSPPPPILTHPPDFTTGYRRMNRLTKKSEAILIRPTSWNLVVVHAIQQTPPSWLMMIQRHTIRL